MSRPNLHFVPLGLRPAEAAVFIGFSVDALERCRDAGWIKPAVATHGLVIYDTADLRLLWNRLKAQGLPPKKQRGTPDQHLVSQEGA
jgi:hypothetical protein